jgi:hypothetical protein
LIQLFADVIVVIAAMHLAAESVVITVQTRRIAEYAEMEDLAVGVLVASLPAAVLDLHNECVREGHVGNSLLVARQVATEVPTTTEL